MRVNAIFIALARIKISCVWAILDAWSMDTSVWSRRFIVSQILILWPRWLKLFEDLVPIILHSYMNGNGGNWMSFWSSSSGKYHSSPSIRIFVFHRQHHAGTVKPGILRKKLWSHLYQSQTSSYSPCDIACRLDRREKAISIRWFAHLSPQNARILLVHLRNIPVDFLVT